MCTFVFSLIDVYLILSLLKCINTRWTLRLASSFFFFLYIKYMCVHYILTTLRNFIYLFINCGVQIECIPRRLPALAIWVRLSRTKLSEETKRKSKKKMHFDYIIWILWTKLNVTHHCVRWTHRQPADLHLNTWHGGWRALTHIWHFYTGCFMTAFAGKKKLSVECYK